MKIGFIGAGNMGQAMMAGLLKSGLVTGENLFVYDHHPERLQEWIDQKKVTICADEKEVIKAVDFVIFAVKPVAYDHLFVQLKSELRDKIVIIMAAGYTLDQAASHLAEKQKIVRIMPNTSAKIQNSMTAMTFNTEISDDEKVQCRQIVASFGEVIELDEKLMNVHTSLSGSLPAIVYVFIEALADGGVLSGMPRDKAYTIIEKTIIGSTQMALQSGKHPALLKDEVTSPSGTTITALQTLENGQFRASLINAIKDCTDKANQMNTKK